MQYIVGLIDRTVSYLLPTQAEQNSRLSFLPCQAKKAFSRKVKYDP
jgi:hypothetical protein